MICGLPVPSAMLLHGDRLNISICDKVLYYNLDTDIHEEREEFRVNISEEFALVERL